MMAPSALARTAVNRRKVMAGHLLPRLKTGHHDHVNVEVDEFGRQHGDP
jgi:hypothetical protein